MDGAGADGVVLAMDIAGSASRAATRVRKTKSLLQEPMRCGNQRYLNRSVCSDDLIDGKIGS
jgi:hypothetical protein